MILNAQTMQESDKIIIGVNQFRQCLQAINIQINDQVSKVNYNSNSKYYCFSCCINSLLRAKLNYEKKMIANQ